MIVLEGINDIGMGRAGGAAPSAAELIAAHQQLIERAHARGLKIIGATLTPFEGAAYFTADGETKRQAINAWMRSGKAFDGIIDFDAATRDPQNPTKFNPQYDSGDHLHPNNAGYGRRHRPEAGPVSPFGGTDFSLWLVAQTLVCVLTPSRAISSRSLPRAADACRAASDRNRWPCA
jgi:lysophospholipase L1-like esterase